MSHFLYILHSKSTDKFYVGESERPEIRLTLHNRHHFKNNFTKIADDWQVVLIFKCLNKDDAVYLERFIKRMKSKIFIIKLIENNSILIDILSKR